MGGTQRLAERAGSGRARQFVMSGELFDAEEMERWGVVNRSIPRTSSRSARGRSPPSSRRPDQGARDDQAHPARFREGGIPAADEAVRTEPPTLFATEDLQNAVKTFLEHGGPGHATFEGR